MAWLTIRYSAGNEHDPGDPWGSSELVIRADGSARLDHHFSRGREPRAWAGHVEPAALGELTAALDRAGFPAVPPALPLPPGSALRRLTVETDDGTQQALVSWHRTPSLPGYAEAFALIDSVIRQLSGNAVQYPAAPRPVVHGAAAVQPLGPRRLPMVRVDKEYIFEGPQGKVTLAQLFAGKRQRLTR